MRGGLTSVGTTGMSCHCRVTRRCWSRPPEQQPQQWQKQAAATRGMLPAAAQQQMLDRSLEPVLQTLIRLEEKLDRIEEKVDALTLEMQARGLDNPPAAQLGWPPAQESEAHAASGAA